MTNVNDDRDINLDHFFETDFNDYSEPDDVAMMREQVIVLVDQLLTYRSRAGALGFQLEKADDFLNKMRAIRDEMRAYEPKDADDEVAQ